LGTVPKSNRKIVEKGKIDNLNTPVHDRSLSWLGAYTSIKSGGVKLVLRADLDNCRWFSLSTPVSSTNKTEFHNITKILLKVPLNTITP
jgi:hypothetical protein